MYERIALNLMGVCYHSIHILSRRLLYKIFILGIQKFIIYLLFHIDAKLFLTL
jgi:hypothetical protein